MLQTLVGSVLSLGASCTSCARNISEATFVAHRWVGLKWFQYEITLAAYCFEWWEKAFVHLCVLGVLSLFAYGFWRQGCAMAPTVSQLAAKYLPRCVHHVCYPLHLIQ